ncbi:Hypothetical protein, putative [Bodo saltans]|uniref:Uncharacterized protein n=1 Tax=Bodo saltans TaxID=75058 RepID=A0A0S4JFW0_BODSA|nr:Hypothetical protein, putative [Bodo saltans]|eukprot:CUG87879.1 Hypothetical protein, putative [Bodo saltans]
MSRALLNALVRRGARDAAAGWSQGDGAQELARRCELMNSCVEITTSTDLESTVTKQFSTFSRVVPQISAGGEELARAVRLMRHRSLMARDRELLLSQLSRSWTSADKAATWTPLGCVEMLHHLALGEVKQSLMESLVVHVQMHHRELNFSAAAMVLWSLSTPSNVRQYAESAVFRLCIIRVTSTLQKEEDISDDGVTLLAEVVSRIPMNVVPPSLCEALGTALGKRPHLDVAPPSGGFREFINAWWITLQPNKLPLSSIRNALRLLQCDFRSGHSVVRSKALSQCAVDIIQSREMLPADIDDIANAVDGMVRFVPPLVQDSRAINTLASTMSGLLKSDAQGKLPFATACRVAVGFSSVESSHAGATDAAPWQLVERVLRESVVSFDVLSPRDFIAMNELLCHGRDETCRQVIDEILTTVLKRHATPSIITELLRCILVASCVRGVDVVVSRVGKLIEHVWNHRELLVMTESLVRPLQQLRLQDAESVPLFLFVLTQWEGKVGDGGAADGWMGSLKTAATLPERINAAVQIATAVATWRDATRQQHALHHLLTQAQTLPWLEPFLLHVPMHRDGVVPALAALPLPDLLLLTEAAHTLHEQAQPHLRNAMVYNVHASIAEGVRQLDRPMSDAAQHQCIVMLLVLEQLYRDRNAPRGAKDLTCAVLDALHSSPTELSCRQESLLAALEVLLVGDLSPRQNTHLLG